jgi:hypothetical protein
MFAECFEDHPDDKSRLLPPKLFPYASPVFAPLFFAFSTARNELAFVVSRHVEDQYLRCVETDCLSGAFLRQYLTVSLATNLHKYMFLLFYRKGTI